MTAAGKGADGARLALLAHDLRTPLSAMRLTADLIGAEPLSERQRGHLDILIRSIDALAEMTGELIRRGRPDAEPEAVTGDARRIVADVVDLFRIAATQKGLTLEVRLPKTAEPLAIAAPMALRRMLAALVDNAVKYTDAGVVVVAIEASATKDGATKDGATKDGATKDGATQEGWLRLSVTDTGPGVDPMERARLFRPYVRGSAGRNGVQGSGLGLWGVAQLVKEAGGRLTLSSPPEGGTCFTLELPLAAAAGGPAPVASHAGIAEPDAEAHVLIVDDNDTNRRLLSALLESFGITCDQAASGTAAVEMVARTPYDAVLLDLHMPGMSGLETAASLRAGPGGDGLPLIAVTAALESVGDRRLRQAGFQEVLAKPLSPAHLFQALDLARRHRRERHA
ncbi:hybrid sensor histidine kinase/response regulator [Polymorphum gilvum]|uniref:histidine kinase n=1 Tax=Polymorphum gilvum (strain LMG 25793 / CGMCC 1.9160 / SL003B-26A1) TaxID=991905 RepID=F2J0D9_POLGS|nr:ATP-binding protein [Polymorphum gilvum]ADZ68673.1 ATPase, histidine kinase-, DNA gyrase B-, and HSP90-like domain protein [Polymorphum gilvum SL003B-26A1]